MCYCIDPHRSERALLNRLMIELYKLDSDVLVGHNISGFDLDVLLHRVQVLILFALSKCLILQELVKHLCITLTFIRSSSILLSNLDLILLY